MLAALWLRVSSDEQHTAAQKPALEAFAATLNVEVAKVYDVTGSAWKGDHRAALNQMLADAVLGEWQVLLCADVTRLSREGGDETLGIVKRLEKVGVQVRSLGDPELQGPLNFGTRLSLMVKGELAHEQSNWRSLATKRGMERAKREGTKSGKPIGRAKGREDSPGVTRESSGYKLEQARRRLAGVWPYNRPKRDSSQ